MKDYPFYKTGKSPIEIGWTQTVSGGIIYFDNPDPRQITIHDIAHHLAQHNRYSGACIFPYSVAQHSVLMSHVVPSKYAYCALLHDSPEAFCHDINTVLKIKIKDQYNPIYQKMEKVIYTKFGLPIGPMPDVIRNADLRMLATEKRDLLTPSQLPWNLKSKPYDKMIVEWDWRYARHKFLKRFSELKPKSLTDY